MAEKLGYVLNKENPDNSIQSKRYYRQELMLMTVYQLREIAMRERIISGIVNPLDKDALVDTIIRYRGAESAMLIRNYRKEDYEILEEAFKHITFRERKGFSLRSSARIVVYRGLSLDYYDNVTINYIEEFKNTNAFLVDSEKRLCAVFNVESKGKDKEHLYLRKTSELPAKEANVKRYNLIFLERYFSDQFFKFYNGEISVVQTNIPAVMVELLDFSVEDPEELKMPAAIDFGTVNTVAGVLDIGIRNRESIYRERVRYATFYDTTHDDSESPLVPSVVGVLSLEDASHPKYAFGYEALALAASSFIDEGFCIFYDIKRWIVDYEKEEELLDRSGRRAFVKRKEILREFFLYLIHSLENCIKYRVKSLHLSCPVKQTHKFQQLFQEILPEYNIERADMIDEGVSVLYNTISEMIENRTVPRNQRIKALIIDCGGGTMDISSCTFKVEDRRVSYKIDIETGYENGSTDFGGNNLTYRILQMLKLRIIETLYHQHLTRKENTLWEARDDFYGIKPSFDEKNRMLAAEIPSLQQIMCDFDRDIFRFIDENGVSTVYDNLEKAYKLAEAILPTKFKDWEKRSREEYFRVRNNFYFLFHCAEQIKKSFFENTFALRVQFCVENGKKHINNKDLLYQDGSINKNETIMIPMDKWKLVLANSSGLSVISDLPDISFSIFEINLLLTPDIYSTVHRFINPLYESGELDEYRIIRLSGQSCKIGIFRAALNEFVPGKVIKSRKESKGDHRIGTDSNNDLKMSCIDGVLKYLRDKKFGYADVTIKSRTPNIPYVLTGFTHTGEEVPVIDGNQNINHGVLSRNMDDLTLTLYLKDDQGKLRHEFIYYCTLDEFTPKRQEEIEAIYGENIPQDDTDNIIDREVKFFVWAEPREWGFLVTPIYRDVETLCMGREQFFAFEDDRWVRNFFDGTH